MITAVRDRSRSKTRRVITAVVALAAASTLALSGCAASGGDGSPSASGDASGTPDLGTLKVVTFLPLQSFTFTPEMYGVASGIFKQHGLDVDLESVNGTPAAIQAVVSGAADISRVDTTDFLPAAEKGQPIVAVGVQAFKSNLRLISTSSDPLNDASDLEGKTIGMGSIGGTSNKILDFAIQSAGVSVDSVTPQVVPVTAATYSLVQQGQLAGYIVSLDTSIQIAQANSDAVVSTVGMEKFPDHQVWFVNTDSLKDPKKLAQIKAYLAAVTETTQAIVADSANDFSNVLKAIRDQGDWQFAALDDDKTAVAALKQYTTKTWVDPDGKLDIEHEDPAIWSDIYEEYVKLGLVTGSIDPAKYFDDQYLPTS